MADGTALPARALALLGLGSLLRLSIPSLTRGGPTEPSPVTSARPAPTAGSPPQSLGLGVSSPAMADGTPFACTPGLSATHLAPPPFLAPHRAPTLPAAPPTPEPASATSLFSSFSFAFFTPPVSPALVSPSASPLACPPSDKKDVDHDLAPRSPSPATGSASPAAPPTPPLRPLTHPEARQLALLLTQHLWPVRGAPKALMGASIALAEDLHAAGVRWDAHRRVMGVHVRGCWEEGSRAGGLGGVGGMELYVQGCFLTVAEKPHPLDPMPLPLELKPARIAALPKLTPHAGLGSSVEHTLTRAGAHPPVPGLTVAHAHALSRAFLTGAGGTVAQHVEQAGQAVQIEPPELMRGNGLRTARRAVQQRAEPGGAVRLGVGLVASSMARRAPLGLALSAASLVSPKCGGVACSPRSPCSVLSPGSTGTPRSCFSPGRAREHDGHFPSSLGTPLTSRTPRSARALRTPRTARSDRLQGRTIGYLAAAQSARARPRSRPPAFDLPSAHKPHGLQLTLGMAAPAEAADTRWKLRKKRPLRVQVER